MYEKSTHRLKGIRALFMLAGAIVLSTISFGQSLTILDEQSNVINGDTIFVEIDVNDISVDVYAGLKNVSSNTIDVNVTRYEVSVLPATSSFFCWGSCTGVTAAGDVPIVTPSGSVNFTSGEMVSCDSSGFTLHYDPNFQLGTSLFRIKFFDIANPLDFSDVYISITSVDQVGVETVSSDQLKFYPNPATNVVSVSGANGFDYQLYSSMGKLLQEGNESSNQIDVSQFPAGVYMLHINSDGREIREMLLIQ